MIYAVYGFLFGMLVPAMARKFEKFMPATAAVAVWSLFKIAKKPKAKRARHSVLTKKLAWRSVVYGFVVSGISYLAAYKFGTEHIAWYLFFFWSLFLLSEIDARMYLLPDVLTIPLLILGFAYAVFVSVWVGSGESVIGAIGGYFLPLIASLFVVWKHQNAFGGGDVKLLAAIGAWFGLEKLLYVIILSTVLFFIYALVKRRREGAYGPAISAAAIVVAFLFL